MSAAAVVPLSLEVNINSLQVDGPEGVRKATDDELDLPDYFRVMRIPLRTGESSTTPTHRLRLGRSS